MKFDDLDHNMRIYETAHDFCVPPKLYIVARIDGRGFTRLTKKEHDFKRPFDEQFRNHMMATVEHLMHCGFNVVYGYTQSDEISLLFHIDENTFNRKTRKFNSILAGEASAKFSTLLGAVGAFDCRLSQFPRKKDVVDYFRWRHEDAHRNSLSAHCYWLLREQGNTARKATQQIDGLSTSDKNELLFQNGINFNELPSWQKRGIGFYWEEVDKEGFNPITNEKVFTKRKQIKADMELGLGDAYSAYIEAFVAND